MAEGALSRWAAAAALLGAGAAAEAAAPAVADGLRIADFAAGATLGCLSAWLLGRNTSAALVGGAAAVAWFLGTLADADAGWAAAIGAASALAYRGPLVHLLLLAPRERLDRPLKRGTAASAWAAGFLPSGVGGPATAVLAASGAAEQAAGSRRAPADSRRAMWATAGCLAALSALWAAAAAGAGGTGLLLLNDLAVAIAGAVALTAAGGLWARGRAGALVVDLGAQDLAHAPVTDRLARALADPDLEIRDALPSGRWVDERGHAVAAPDEHDTVTRAAAPGGGEVALLHGGGMRADPRLVAAATAAAALALDSARLDADVRAQSAEVRASRRRLLTAADRERRTLAERLERSPLPRLRHVRQRLARSDAALTRELDAAMTELAALAHGLYPPGVALRRLPEALEEMAARSVVAAQLRLDGDLRALPDDVQAAIWFFCSEALANVARHSGATAAEIDVTAAAAGVVIEISDDGRGGATLERGLRGLSDRAEALGGVLTVDSPMGGPTAIRLELPVRGPAGS